MTHDLKATLALTLILGFTALVSYSFGWRHRGRIELDRLAATRLAVHLAQIRDHS